VKTVHLLDDTVILSAQEFLSISSSRNSKDIQLATLKQYEPKDFSVIHYRPDPPVDLKYIHPLQLLSFGIQGTQSKIINPPNVLALMNEKFSGAALRHFMPRSLVSSEWDRLKAFGRSEKTTVLKPLYQAQSKGIELIDWRTDDGIQNAKSVLANATDNFRQPVLLQKFLKGISDGEVRILYLDDTILGTVKKLPLEGDFRIQIDRGSKVEPYSLNAREKKMAQAIGKHLKKSGIRFAAIDLIDGHLTDYNFTSPGLVVQMEQVLNKNLAQIIVKSLK
jgi:glutathione synthase